MTTNISGDVNKSINGSLLIGIGLIVLGIVAIAPDYESGSWISKIEPSPGTLLAVICPRCA